MRLKHISKFIFCAVLAISAGSCNKLLDIDPQQSIDAEIALATADDLEAAVVGCYSIMGGPALYGTNLFLLADLQASENYCSWTGTFQGQRQVAAKTMNRNNSEASRVWTSAYSAINMANIVLSKLDIVTDDAKRDQLEGEALFVRGIMHFELVRYYGLPWDPLGTNTQPGVVIKTTATLSEEQGFERLPRNTVAEVYAQVINDLTTASQKLPDDNGNRADRYTALAFLARVYLQQSNFAMARDMADLVINALDDFGNPKYEVGPSVNTPFTNKNTSETIWEIQQNEQNNAGTSNDGMATFYANLTGIGRADVVINSDFIDLYPAGDLRSTEWYYDGVDAAPTMHTSKWSSFSQNLPVIRSSEMYLIRAETNARLGTTVGATPENDLAVIRNPSRTNTAVIAAPTVDDVLAERYLELAFEGVRIHDIKRLKGSTGSFAWDADRLVFPIPQREIDATEGVLVQNDGY